MAIKSLARIVVTDDFKQITGIGPAIERRLHDGGIQTFAQLAALSPQEVAVFVSDLAGMSIERIIQQNWIGQARKLASESAPTEVPQAVAVGNHQHDISFTIKLLINEDNTVRRTQLVDNRSKTEEQWAGWDEVRLLEAIKKGAALRPPAAGSAPVTAPLEAEPVEAVSAELPVAGTTEVKPVALAVSPAPLTGTLQLRALEPLPADSASPHRVLSHNVPLRVRLDLDLSEVVRPNAEPLHCTATVYAKRLGSHERRIIGEDSSSLGLGDQPTLFIACQPLPAGTYRLDALVIATHPTTEIGLRAYLEGGFLQVN